jgi:hypothetical protein
MKIKRNTHGGARVGAGRPKLAQRNVHLPPLPCKPAFRANFIRAAHRAGLSQNDFHRDCIEELVSALDENPEKWIKYLRTKHAKPRRRI